MAGKTYHLEVYTQASKVLDAQVHSMTVPAEDGMVGVLANHAPLMTVLGRGRMMVEVAGEGEKHFELSGGFLEVHANKATVLTDSLTPVA